MFPSKNLDWSFEVGLSIPNLGKSWLFFHWIVSMHKTTKHKGEVWSLTFENPLFYLFCSTIVLRWLRMSKPEILQNGHNNNLMSNIGAIISYSSYIINLFSLICFIKDMKTKTRCFQKELRWNARGFIDLKQTLCSNQM
jgi:hypothetical protein